MQDFTVNDVLLGLKQECGILQDNWQGETASVYIDKVMNSYINYVIVVEKCLQEINQGIHEVRSILEDDSDPIYEHEQKRFQTGGSKK